MDSKPKGNPLVALAFVAAVLLFVFWDKIPFDRVTPVGGDEVTVAAKLWEQDVRSTYAEAVKQEFATDKAAFEWLRTRMKAATEHATEGIRKAEGDTAKDGWTLNKARTNWERWGR